MASIYETAEEAAEWMARFAQIVQEVSTDFAAREAEEERMRQERDRNLANARVAKKVQTQTTEASTSAEPVKKRSSRKAQGSADTEVENMQVVEGRSNSDDGVRRSDRKRKSAKIFEAGQNEQRTPTVSSVDMSVGRVSENVYYVEKIVDVRKKRNKLEYFAKWWKWPAESNTWEPEAHFISGSMLEIFWNKNRKHVLYPQSCVFKERNALKKKK